MVSATPEQVVLPKTRNTTSFSVVRLKLSFQSYVPITHIQSRSSVHFVISFDQVRHRSFFPPELSVLFPIWIPSSRQAILFCPTYILLSPWTHLSAATAGFSLSIQVVLRLIEEGSLSDFLLTAGKSHDFLRKPRKVWVWGISGNVVWSAIGIQVHVKPWKSRWELLFVL